MRGRWPMRRRRGRRVEPRRHAGVRADRSCRAASRSRRWDGPGASHHARQDERRIRTQLAGVPARRPTIPLPRAQPAGGTRRRVPGIPRRDWPHRVIARYSRVACAAPGFVLFARAGSLVAQRFDAETGATSGDELPVASGVKSHSEGDGAFDVSATGVLVYRRNETLRTTRLVLRDRSGRELQAIGEPALYRHPRFSPDGTRVVTERATSDATNADLWLFDLGRGTASRLTRHPAADLRPAWSPDGRFVAFSSARSGDSHLYRVPSGSSRRRRTAAGGGRRRAARWVAARRTLARRDPDARRRLATVVDGRPPVQVRGVFPQGAEPSQASVAPDGRWFAYMAGDSGAPEV